MLQIWLQVLHAVGRPALSESAAHLCSTKRWRAGGPHTAAANASGVKSASGLSEEVAVGTLC